MHVYTRASPGSEHKRRPKNSHSARNDSVTGNVVIRLSS